MHNFQKFIKLDNYATRTNFVGLERVFCQSDEDGLTLEILKRMEIDMETYRTGHWKWD